MAKGNRDLEGDIGGNVGQADSVGSEGTNAGPSGGNSGVTGGNDDTSRGTIGSEGRSPQGEESSESGISPEAVAGEEQPKQRKRRADAGQPRGPRGPRAKKGKAGLALTPEELAPRIQGLHSILAMMTQQPVFEIQSAEAKQLANAICDVASYYEIDLSGPYAAWINLAAVCGVIYLPRVLHVRSEASRARQRPITPATPEDATIVPRGGIDFSADVAA